MKIFFSCNFPLNTIIKLSSLSLPVQNEERNFFSKDNFVKLLLSIKKIFINPSSDTDGNGFLDFKEV